ncbi:hypothetical protein BRADI_3g36325v3 [Brachypodium distachyon]|uniref:Uncharacterized protein n=1 Tax=Brachypodium distachyon TaxID=15368 RepID=A0A0Q3ID40_BRADI|nr:hypothetical protein BRADI_3g36325v3 [Brachypodium distachyon]
MDAMKPSPPWHPSTTQRSPSSPVWRGEDGRGRRGFRSALIDGEVYSALVYSAFRWGVVAWRSRREGHHFLPLCFYFLTNLTVVPSFQDDR